MKITILETGRAPGKLVDEYPRYPDMFAALLSPSDRALAYESIAVLDGEAFPDASACQAVLITGSPFGVYDSTPWMDPLRGFIRAAHAAKVPMVGICFGHQIIADALGGEVRKSEKGWGIGRHTYDITRKREWMGEGRSCVSLSASHQDQVITPPAGAVTLARSAHTEHAMLEYADAPVVTIQGHPEFSDSYASALWQARRGKALSDAQVDAALASMAKPGDGALVGDWIVRFMRGAR
jgi:GMP synthase-like glutamine amidotransferase